MTKAMKVGAPLVALCLAACPVASMAPGGGDPGMPPMGDPADDSPDDPYLADINNAWGGSLGANDQFSFTFSARPGGKISSAVVTTTSGSSKDGMLTVDGLFYGNTVHLTVIQGVNTRMLDGIFINAEVMDLTIQDTQARIELFCSTSDPPCK